MTAVRKFIAPLVMIVCVFDGTAVLAQAADSSGASDNSQLPSAVSGDVFQPELTDEGERPVLSPEERKDITRYVIGNTAFVAMHLLGHRVLAESGASASEDAADFFAIHALLAEMARVPEFGTGMTTLAEGWAIQTDMGMNPGYASSDFAVAHGLSGERIENLICLLYGGDSESFGHLVDDGQVPWHRLDDCIENYEKLLTEWLAQRVGKAGTGQPVSDDGGKLPTSVSFAESADSELSEWLRRVEESGRLESIVDGLAGTAWIPGKPPIRFEACGRPHGYLEGDRIVVCHELVGIFVKAAHAGFF